MDVAKPSSAMDANCVAARAYCAESPLNYVDRRALLVGLSIIASLAVVIQHWVLPLHDHVAVLAGSCVGTFASYFVLDAAMLRSVESYASIESKDKRYYVLSNLIKSLLLGALTPLAALLLVDTLWFDRWDNVIIKNMGSLYACTDAVSMLLVRRQTFNTKVHHLVVCIFNYFSLLNDYETENVCRCILVYAVFSSFAYLVNLLLASRFVQIHQNLSVFLSRAALVTYVACCVVNWSWQLYYVRHLSVVANHFSIYIYVALLGLVVWDDLVLQKWLCANSKRTKAA